ncbi:protein of unknown function [Desulfuromusa kysingii]|uniref:DUF309 domain-containing protein n=1 Tax=Desulfuromusa kysingii TaxID=37625 RepID=A0A1H4E4B6_9BACT|nr:DUF309 domain-containing protein [Desulfuromusa kysingii]SEA79619.1 protein of unknown function [Desulfuromusa kysingii]
MEPEFITPNSQRYSVRPFPAYRHLPFTNAHPFLDQDGHSYGEKLTPVDSFTTQNWHHCDEYLYSIDLFNHGFWWEAHERLKYVSIGAGRESEIGQFVQGLIQIAAALLKHFMQEETGASTLAELGAKRLQTFTGLYLGIDVDTLLAQLQDCLKTADAKYPQIHLVIS